MINQNKDFLYRYLSLAPIPLAIERVLECGIFCSKIFRRPILDIGCGDGLFAHVLFNEKVDVGIDPDSRELRRAKEYGSYRELIPCAGNQIPKPSGYFQTIFSNSVLEHIEDIGPVLREAHRLLAEGGRFYVTVPTTLFERYNVITQICQLLGLKSWGDRYSRFFNRFWRHYHCYDPEKWRIIFEENRFKVLEVVEYDPQAVAVFNDALVPFSILGFFNKKIFNQWVILERFRKLYILPAYFLIKYFLRTNNKIQKGGIVFFALTKG